MNLALTVTKPFRPRYQTALQFGIESKPILNNSDLVQFLQHKCSSTGTTPIIHQVDHLHPLEENFLHHLKRNLRLSHQLGAPCLIVHLPPCPVDTINETATILTSSSLLKFLYNSNVNIALENPGYREPPPFFGRLENIVKLTEDITHLLGENQREDLEKRFRLCFDYGHFTVYACHRNLNIEKRVKRFLSVVGEKIQVLHVHINDGTADQHLLLGERPERVNLPILMKMEKTYLTAIKSLGDENRVFIVEKNSPFQAQDMVHCFQVLDQSLIR